MEMPQSSSDVGGVVFSGQFPPPIVRDTPDPDPMCRPIYALSSKSNVLEHTRNCLPLTDTDLLTLNYYQSALDPVTPSKLPTNERQNSTPFDTPSTLLPRSTLPSPSPTHHLKLTSQSDCFSSLPHYLPPSSDHLSILRWPSVLNEEVQSVLPSSTSSSSSSSPFCNISTDPFDLFSFSPTPFLTTTATTTTATNSSDNNGKNIIINSNNNNIGERWSRPDNLTIAYEDLEQTGNYHDHFLQDTFISDYFQHLEMLEDRSLHQQQGQQHQHQHQHQHQQQRQQQREFAETLDSSTEERSAEHQRFRENLPLENESCRFIDLLKRAPERYGESFNEPERCMDLLESELARCRKYLPKYVNRRFTGLIERRGTHVRENEPDRFTDLLENEPESCKENTQENGPQRFWGLQENERKIFVANQQENEPDIFVENLQESEPESFMDLLENEPETYSEGLQENEADEHKDLLENEHGRFGDLQENETDRFMDQLENESERFRENAHENEPCRFMAQRGNEAERMIDHLQENDQELEIFANVEENESSESSHDSLRCFRSEATDKHQPNQISTILRQEQCLNHRKRTFKEERAADLGSSQNSYRELLYKFNEESPSGNEAASGMDSPFTRIKPRTSKVQDGSLPQNDGRNFFDEVIDSPVPTLPRDSRRDVNEPKRPKNGFIRFSMQHRGELSRLHPYRDNRTISKMLGIRWKKMTAVEKRPYEEEFSKDIHQIRRQHPLWRYAPARRSALDLVEPMSTRLRPRDKIRSRFQDMEATEWEWELTDDMILRDDVMKSATSRDDVNRKSPLQRSATSWRQCHLCSLWRPLPGHLDTDDLPPIWSCPMNPDQRFNVCGRAPSLPTQLPPSSIHPLFLQPLSPSFPSSFSQSVCPRDPVSIFPSFLERSSVPIPFPSLSPSFSPSFSSPASSLPSASPSEPGLLIVCSSFPVLCVAPAVSGMTRAVLINPQSGAV